MSLRLTLSNRLENLEMLEDFLKKWAQQRGLSPSRRSGLERVAGIIFRQLVTQAYPPHQPGSIAIMVEEKGPRLRLVFEDDAPPHPSGMFNGLSPPGTNSQPNAGASLKQSALPVESLVYYRTGDHKNRLVVFLSL